MVIRRVPNLFTWCQNCRRALVRAFISSSVLCTPAIVRPRYAKVGAKGFSQSASFATLQLRRLHTEQQPLLETPSSAGINELDAEKLVKNEDAPQEPTSSIPWYLQIDTPQRASNPLLERHQLPPLPPQPPPLLKPLLEHISVDLGLDDLTLFDLRKIDPPPALGANLLMVIGTARSEKHLHVSADRFCRWLKVTHKLSPYADGLLGRGELKLKLRRKARRAKLLSNVGSSETAAADDGLRTGWICVNVGTIQDGRDTVENFTEQEGYVGFGSQMGGAKVVVQMLTQEKREELDLESLWGKMLKRQERKEGRITKGPEAFLSDQEVGESSMLGERLDSDSRISFSSRFPRLSIVNVPQARHFHQSTINLPVAFDRSEGLDAEVDTSKSRKKQGQKAQDENSEVIDHGFGSLRSHMIFLKGSSSQSALRLLGTDAFDVDSTPFLKSFYGSYPQTPNAAHWKYRLILVCHGIIIGHSGYTKNHLIELLQQMQSFVTVPEDAYLLVFKTLLTPNPMKTAETGWPTLTKESLCNAIVVLDSMHSCGFEIRTIGIRKRLQRAVKQIFRDRGEIRTGDPDRLKVTLDNLHARLHHSPSYPICLRMLIECCDALPMYRKHSVIPEPQTNSSAPRTSDQSHP